MPECDRTSGLKRSGRADQTQIDLADVRAVAELQVRHLGECGIDALMEVTLADAGKLELQRLMHGFHAGKRPQARHDLRMKHRVELTRWPRQQEDRAGRAAIQAWRHIHTRRRAIRIRQHVRAHWIHRLLQVCRSHRSAPHCEKSLQ